MLTAFRILYNDESTSVTNMAAGVTLEQAQNYFIGNRFEITEKTFRTAVKVEQLPICSDCKKAFERKFEGNPIEIRCEDCQIQFRITKKTAHERYLDQLRAEQMN